jgi:AcrR family transcriptional regulator
MPNPIPRRRDAVVTRDTILLSARKAFAQSGYEAAGLSEIAADAGVTLMLIQRYFDSKEQLFAEVIAKTLAKTDPQVVIDLLKPLLHQGVDSAPAAT